MRLSLLLFALILLCIPQSADAQSVPIGDPFEEYLRILQHEITEGNDHSYNIRPTSRSEFGTAKSTQHSSIINNQSHPWARNSFFSNQSNQRFQFYAPKTTITYNTAFPAGQNDGAMWQGRGLNSGLSFGGSFTYGILEVAFRPEMGFAQNRDFPLYPITPVPEVSEYSLIGISNPRMDAPQRFGNSTHTWFDSGQSFIKLQYGGISAGVSTENMWVGPAMYNPLMMSNHAPGFFHAFLQTERPIPTPIGNIEGKVFWGSPKESDYYFVEPREQDRFISGITLNYSPSFIEGLHVGLFRGAMEYWPDDGFGINLLLLPVSGQNKDFAAAIENTSNQMFSLFGRWKHSNSGFEAYFEWGRNDNFRDGRDLSIALEHSRAYVLGFMKPFKIDQNRLLSVNFEMTHLQTPRTVAFRSNGPFYEHSAIREGWTNRGQVLGAGIMMGSNNQKLMVKLYERWGMAGISFNRIEHMNDRLWFRRNAIVAFQDDDVDVEFRELQEVEFRPGFHALLFLPNNLEMQTAIYPSFFRNRNNLYQNNERNLNVQVTLRYQLPGFAR
ncbi:MAG: capsule assembly Wzi family protein [Balneolaceae bacterium]